MWSATAASTSVFWNGWGNVPSRFHSVSLETLAPLADLAISHDRQAMMIAALQRNPRDSYLMFGKPNTEKTHLMVALYREALQKGTRREIGMNHIRQSMWRAIATVLMNQTIVWALERGKEFKTWSKEPLMTSEKIGLAVKDGYRPCLFLDELDKNVCD